MISTLIGLFVKLLTWLVKLLTYGLSSYLQVEMWEFTGSHVLSNLVSSQKFASDQNNTMISFGFIKREHSICWSKKIKKLTICYLLPDKTEYQLIKNYTISWYVELMD